MTGPTPRADADLERRAILAEERLRAISMLITGATHEINNPLTAIQSLVSHVSTEVPDGDARNDLDIILTETERTVQIVRNLQAFAGQTDDPRQSQLNDAVRQVADARGYEIRARCIELDLDLAADISYVAATMPELLFLTLQMLLWAEQALAATPPRHENLLDDGGRRASRIVVRTGLQEPGAEAWMTIDHDGLSLEDEVITSLTGREGLTAGRDGSAVAGGDPALVALAHAAADIRGSLTGSNPPGRGASLTVHIPTVQAEDSVAGMG